MAPCLLRLRSQGPLVFSGSGCHPSCPHYHGGSVIKNQQALHPCDPRCLHPDHSHASLSSCFTVHAVLSWENNTAPCAPAYRWHHGTHTASSSPHRANAVSSLWVGWVCDMQKKKKKIVQQYLCETGPAFTQEKGEGRRKAGQTSIPLTDGC